jgi:hypothetical protein
LEVVPERDLRVEEDHEEDHEATCIVFFEGFSGKSEDQRFPDVGVGPHKYF